MAKTSKKALGATMAGVMAVGAVAGAVQSLDQVNVANAAESQALNAAKAKISHLTYSIKNNYLGIKNQGQWEEYIKEARKLILAIPSAEKAQADALTDEVNKDEELVKAVARINQVEKSIAENSPRIGNVKQWKEYLDNGRESLKSVNQTVFANQYAEIVERLGKADASVKKIEEDYKKDLAAATKLYDDARSSMVLVDAEKALEAAKKLGSADETTALISKIETLISTIKSAKVDVKSVEVESKTYDDDTKNQRLAIKVNGESMNIDFLKGVGYDVNFKEIDGKGSDLFESSTGTGENLTGILKNEPKIGDYKVQVTVSKAGVVVVSQVADIKIANLDNKANSVTSIDFENGAINQVSGTLVVGESLKLDNLKIAAGNSSTKVTGGELNKVTLKSSDSSILVVNNTDHTVRAIGLGTAKITVSYGTITKEITYNSVGEARKLTKVTADSNSINVATGSKDNSIEFKTLDQYGDPFIITTTSNPVNKDQVKIESTGKLTSVNTATVSSDDKRDGLNEITFNAGDNEESAVIYLKDYKNNSIGQFSIRTLKDAGILSTKLEVKKESGDSAYSEDTKLLINSGNDNSKHKDYKVKIKLNEYTTEGIERGAAEFGGSVVTFDRNLVNVTVGGTAVTSGTAISSSFRDKEIEVSIAPNAKAGSTNLNVTKNGKTFTLTITVALQDDISIKGVNWTDFKPNAGVIVKASDVLTLSGDSANDPVLKSVNLSADSIFSVRISKADGKAIYLDKNANGVYDSGSDLKLGELHLAGTGNFTSTNALDGQRIYAGDKGSIVFSVKVQGEGSDYDKTIATKGYSF